MNLVESKTNEQAMQHHFYPYTDNGGLVADQILSYSNFGLVDSTILCFF